MTVSEFIVFLFAQNQVSELWLPFLVISVCIGLVFQRLKGRPLRPLVPRLVDLRADVVLWLSGRLVEYLLLWVFPVVSIAWVFTRWGDPAGAVPGVAAWLVFGLVHFVLGDLSFWFLHWLRHKVPLLWSLHAVHHSATHLNPVTGYRRHPFERLGLFFALPTLRAFPAVPFVWLYPGVQEQGLVLGVFIYILFFATYSALQHSLVWMSFGPVLERVLISPAMHQVHHSIDPRHARCNYGQVLAVWDWLFGTLITSDQVDPTTLRFGVEGLRHESMRELFVEPIVAFGRQLRLWVRV